MNLNPFVFSYKIYPKSMLATMVNKLCSALQRLMFLFALLILLFILLGEVSNWGEAICGVGVLFLLWFILKFYKDKWSDKIAAKQEDIDKTDDVEKNERV